MQKNIENKTIAIVGIGLIGGSMALALKKMQLASTIIGVDINEGHEQKALELKLVDKILPINEAVKAADIVILSIPVNAAELILPSVLDNVNRQIVMDMGSTKKAICKIAQTHKNSGRFVATHPMWGTEFSGPEAAVDNAFTGKATVICNVTHSDKDALHWVENMYRKLGMHVIHMNASSHDLHVAYVSHISHITSFALANTVLEKEKNEKAIFELSSSGFESTVRLAKSNPKMWMPIFLQNKKHVLEVLDEHILQLEKFRTAIADSKETELEALMIQANKIKRILK